MNFLAPYVYHFENVSVSFQPGVLELSVIIAGIFLCIAAIIIGPYVYGYFIRSAKESERLEKRRMLQNLIVMKEVQTELEEEMRRALTNVNVS